ncbi:hypothetical protein PLEOSDRAFT_171179 [Pleurotus ostreatus PC15]|uniref:DUF6534 domain-containing protein n=1 Tax=Pleurotus ostreatus (strain PC15) TaxID=1137138 RepID=A0A067N962_PLEO1|nr:hypothetical protein PLEOSDRAFT_171179 [Pleurotus ostreatus PC15]
MPETQPVVVAPLLFGLVVSCPLFGVSIAQSIYYYKTYPMDSKYLKYFIQDWTQHFLQHYFSLIMSKLVHTTSLHMIPWAPGFVERCIYMRRAYMARVYALSAGNKWISAILTHILWNMIVLDDKYSNQATHVVIISIHHTSAEIFGGLQLAASVVCDVLITSSLVFYLRDNRGEFKRTQNVVDRLVIYSINVGMVTSIISLSALITWFAMPDNFIFSTFHILIGKVYFNSWLVTLNARKTMRSRLDDTSQMSGFMDLSVFRTRN